MLKGVSGPGTKPGPFCSLHVCDYPRAGNPLWQKVVIMNTFTYVATVGLQVTEGAVKANGAVEEVVSSEDQGVACARISCPACHSLRLHVCLN